MNTTPMRLIKRHEGLPKGPAVAARAHTSDHIYHAKPDEGTDPRLNHAPRPPYLDVDAVLARSLRKVTGE